MPPLRSAIRAKYLVPGLLAVAAASIAANWSGLINAMLPGDSRPAVIALRRSRSSRRRLPL